MTNLKNFYNDGLNVSDGLNSVITKLQFIRKDYPEGNNKKKLQRIAERLRKACQDIEDTLKNQ